MIYVKVVCVILTFRYKQPKWWPQKEGMEFLNHIADLNDLERIGYSQLAIPIAFGDDGHITVF